MNCLGETLNAELMLKQIENYEYFICRDENHGAYACVRTPLEIGSLTLVLRINEEELDFLTHQKGDIENFMLTGGSQAAIVNSNGIPSMDFSYPIQRQYLTDSIFPI